MTEVSVVVSDPWSFVDEQGSNTFAATVLATDGELLLLKLGAQHYVANPRGDEGAYNLIPVSKEQSQEAPPWGRDLWRGDPAALLADIHGLGRPDVCRVEGGYARPDLPRSARIS